MINLFLRTIKYYLLIIFIFIGVVVKCQELSNYRQYKLLIENDTISLDTFSIIPASFRISGIDSFDYKMDYTKSILIIKSELPTDSVAISYRVFPFNFSDSYQRRDSSENFIGVTLNPFRIKEEEIDYTNLFTENELQKGGSISRGINFGNTRDLSISSNLNLQLSGKIQDIEILAAISDNNIPIQPDGNTQQLQDFDRVFVQFSKNNHKIIAGDFQFLQTEDEFLKLNKKVQGLGYSGIFKQGNQTIKTDFNGALSRGQFARNSFFGTEGNQGPYQLTGTENERFIIVLSGTERVYIDGRLLDRGMNGDYTINYNTGEITFTGNQIITKDKRIVVEFQYTSRNYSRTLLYSSNEIDWNEKTKLSVNLYSEQDMKFQPINQQLSQEDIDLLAEVGDSLNLAAKTAVFIDTSETENSILYQKIDSVIGTQIYTVYQQSDNPNTAIYSLTFSNVGFNNGNYVLSPSSVNGRVFTWVAPINGLPQGNYEPVVILVSPKQQQMATISLEHQINKKSVFFVEAAISNENQNTFSKKNKSDDQGLAVLTTYNFFKNLGGKTGGWKLKGKQSYQVVSDRFREVERFRSVEFQRDWNLASDLTETEHWVTSELGLFQLEKERLKISSSFLNRGSFYTGWKNNLVTNTKLWKGARINGKASLLNSRGTEFNSEFLRHNLTMSQEINKFTLSVWEEQERNVVDLIGLDSLLLTSINFNIYGSSLGFSNDKYSSVLSYEYRIDDLPVKNKLIRNTEAENYVLEFSNQSNKNKILTKTTYRRLTVIDSILSGQKDENTLLNRIDYRLNWWKGFVSATTFYEVGTGNELKRTFSYVDVLPGQGSHSWIDYNNDGKQQINEFEIAQFQDQANYIRVFLPTNEFVTTFSNQLNHSLSLFPSKILSRDKKWKKFLTRFSNQFFVNLNEKTVKTNDALLTVPFIQNISDEDLISLTTNQRNTLYFNRSNPVFGANYTWGKNASKSLLVNGLEGRVLLQNIVDFRWNFVKSFSLQLKLEQQEKQRTSELFSANEFYINSNIAEPTLSYQPNANFRLNFNMSIKEKKNELEFGGESSLFQKIGSELTFAIAEKGRLNIGIDYINTTFNNSDDGNSPLRFEMLEGLQVGNNYTWEFRFQQNFQNNMQANISYNGRASETAKIVHTASVQVQLLF